MSQPRERHAGSRASGQRQPRHPKHSSPNPQGRSYVKAPSRETDHTASIFKTRSFQFLVNVVGAENIALGLESSMTRISELLKGEKFTPETAFHIETTLGLPHGFFDQSHPALAPETIARLRSPLDLLRPDEAPEAVSTADKSDSNSDIVHHLLFEDRLPEDAGMPKKAVSGSTKAAAKKASVMSKEPTHQPTDKAAHAKPVRSSTPIQQQALSLTDDVSVDATRRANLHVLTSRKGSKVRLAVVMQMSDSNMAHRLYGKKRMDVIEANRFTERLGLPNGWLDVPRSAHEVPDFVAQLLTPAWRGQALRKDVEGHIVTTIDETPTMGLAGTDQTGITPPTGLGDMRGADLSADVPHVTAVHRLTDHVGEPVIDASKGRPAKGTDDHQIVRAAVEAPLSPLVRAQAVGSHACVTSLENLNGIEPVAEALIKTLAGKARTGRLDELKALELLQQAVRL
jgi:hypothetical protein